MGVGRPRPRARSDRKDVMMEDWTPTSWRERPLAQAARYPDDAALRAVFDAMSVLPTLVTSWEIEALRDQLAAAQRGELFLLQGGDCAERFADCRAEPIVAKLKILLQASMVLSYGTGRRVIRMGRLAGQYAKPRSSDTETRGGLSLPAYRGDLINQTDFTPEARTPDPRRLLTGYERAALTLNFVRGLVSGGFADMHHAEWWNLDFAAEAPLSGDYLGIVERIKDSLALLETVTGRRLEEVRRLDFFTCHEGLSLDYEQALTRRVPRRTGWYDLSTHFPWIGNRTRDPGGAHVEFFRGIANPLGVKIGSGLGSDELLELIARLNPRDEEGRLTLIHRFGAGRIAAGLPPLVEAVRRAGKKVLWVCDPMHGNTLTTASGIKTRRFEDIRSEIEQAFDIHHAAGSLLGGIHFELTGENVTECTGGARGLTEDGLTARYESQVDPRLNVEQALEMALLVARRLKSNGRKKKGG